MLTRFKYDVAIAVAEEDLKIAETIAASFKLKKISYYLYTEQSAENWGQYVLKISLAKYGAEARYVLVILSKAFTEKYWASIESQIVQIFKPKKEVYILPLLVDDVKIDGINKYIAFLKWADNDDKIAENIKHKLRKRKTRTYKRRAVTMALSTIVLAVLYFSIFLMRASPDYSKYLAFVNQGDSLVQQNRFSEAKGIYSQALLFNPRDMAVSRKLELLDSADQTIKKQNHDAAKKYFQMIIDIPASQRLTTAALGRMGVTYNPPISISIRWNGSFLEIRIFGGVPFSNSQRPYLVEGIDCQDCIRWKKEDSNYVASVPVDKVKAGKIQFKDRLGQFLAREVPTNPFSKVPGDNNMVLPSSNNNKESPYEAKTQNSNAEAFFIYVAAGDSLFKKEKFLDAKNEYTYAKKIRPSDANVAKKLAACDAKIKESDVMIAKNIPKVNIPNGSFVMGSENGNPHDGPEHTVKIQTFSISKTEVTVAQYQNFCSFTGRQMPPMPSYGWIDDCPIVNVTWNEAIAYCEWVGGELPSEAQWEYAASSNSNELYSGGGQVNVVAWHSGNAQDKPSRVAKKQANNFGLYDMTGNVSEWCRDWYSSKYYTLGQSDNPIGPTAGSEKVIRGGAYNSYINSTQDGNQLRITYRNSEAPTSRKPYIGFRVIWNK
jgi:formylglycine-generating enzyme